MGLEVGDSVPNFIAKNDQNIEFDSSSLVGKKPLVIYFYPKNFTPGCIKEACDFRDSYEEFKELGVEVIGISADNVSSHARFKNKYTVPFMFLSDVDGQLRKLFGVATGLFGMLPGRETYVIDKKGKIILKFNSINASKHLKKAILTVKKMMNE